MIQHILKIIWTERRINFWILLELLLIFCIVWFCTDYLTFMYQRYLAPTGFDIENTYMIEVSQNADYIEKLLKDGNRTKEELLDEYGWLIYERIKRHPDVLHASLSNNAFPYNGGMNSRHIFPNEDTIPVKKMVYSRSVSPEYFNVFNIKFESGSSFTWNDTNKRVAVLNGDENNYVGNYPTHEVKTIKKQRDIAGDVSYEVIGVVQRTKRDPFYPYENEIYELFDKTDIQWLGVGATKICIRTKENIDPDLFVEKFTEEMYDQLNVGVFYLVKVMPFEAIKEKYLFWQDYDNNFKSIVAVISFLLANVFLGLIGTFWFRIRQRRGEIGLRMAMGSSQEGVKRIFIGETLLMVIIASLVGTLISFNISIADFLKDIGFPMIRNRDYESVDWIQYLLNFGITFIIITVVSSLAVWYPVRQAAKTQPASALRDE